MREELKRFYHELQEWVDEGMPPHADFYPECGLCASLYDWADRRYGSDTVDALYDTQRAMFREAGLDKDFPFDTEESYQQAYMNDAMYRNPKRLAWIKEHAV